MSGEGKLYLLFVALYLVSFAVALVLIVLLLIGIFNQNVMQFVSLFATPTLIFSVISLTVFKYLIARIAKNVRASNG